MSEKQEQTDSLIRTVINFPSELYSESKWLLNRCTKPTRDEFIAIGRAVATGFLLMGFTGYFVKLVHIPINNIIVGGA